MAEKQGAPSTEEQEMEEEKQNSEKEEESEEEESDDEEYFEVEKIISRKKRNGVFLYRVRWKGYPPSNDTWEPVDNLDVVLDMVEEYDAKEEQKAKARQEERRLRKLRMEGKKLPGEESSDSSNSSDDERLLNEDTKFFKMLEKNKDIVFGQPDLYSKVKSRTATLASKKKSEESQGDASSASVSRSGRARQEKRDGSRGNRRGRQRGRGTGRGRGRASQKSISDDSEESDDSEKSAPRRSSWGQGRGRSRKKKPISESSDEAADSDDSVPLANLGKSSQKGGRAIGEDSEDSTASDKVSAPRKPARSAPPKSGKKQASRKPAERKKTTKGGKQGSDSVEKESEKNVPESDTDRDSDASPKPEKETAIAGEKPDAASLLGQQDEENEAGGRKPVSSAQSPATSKTTPAKSKAEKTEKTAKSLLTTPARSRGIIPVLEKFAQSSLGQGIVEEKQRLSGEAVAAAAPSGDKEESGEVKTASVKEAPSSCSENMEMETPEKKQNAKGAGKKKGSSRKRKQDTAAEHAKAVTEGEASPVKTSAVSPLRSPADEARSMPGETDSPSAPMEINRQEVTHSDSDSEDTALPTILPPSKRKISLEKKVPPLRITVPKLQIDPPKLKLECPRPNAQSPKAQFDSVKLEKQKSKGEGVKSGSVSRDSHTLPSGEKTSSKVAQLPIRPSKDSVRDSVSSDVFRSRSPSAPSCGTAAAVKKDPSGKAVSVTSVSHYQHGLLKPEFSSRLARPEVTDSRGYVKSEPVTPRTVKPEPVDRTGRQEQAELKTARPEALDSRRKYGSGSGFTSTTPTSEVSREPVFSVFSSPPSAGRDVPSTSRDSVLSGGSRDTSGLFSSYSASRDTSSLSSSVRDSVTSGRGTGLSSASASQFSPLFRDSVTSGRGTTSLSSSSASQFSPSFRDSHLTSWSSRDPHLGSGPSTRDLHLSSGSGRDIHLGSGYIHLSSGSSRDSSSFSSPSSRDSLYPRGDPKNTSAGASRHGLSTSISGKENADRPLSVKSLTSVPKKGDGVQPLDTILNSSLYAADSDKSKQYKGLDSDFDMVLQRIDLEYLEKLLLPAVTPMELNDEELRQAVVDGNCYLVERALACTKPYNLDLPDNKGYTLLMNAVLGGSDDIIVHLLSRGADAQVQVNGNTALMLAVDHAESSTVFMLLEMGAHVNTADHSGETALFKAVRRGDKQILKLILDHGANFTLVSRAGLSPLQMAKQYRLADVETTLIDHIQRVVRAFEEQVHLTVRGTAKLVSCLFPHHCVPLYESDTIAIPFKYQPTLPTGPGMGCLLFIAHARFNQQEVKCRLYGQCAVEKVTLNGVLQPCLTEESNFVLMCHPLIAGWNELVIHTRKDATSKAKLIVCAYKAQLICT